MLYIFCEPFYSMTQFSCLGDASYSPSYEVKRKGLPANNYSLRKILLTYNSLQETSTASQTKKSKLTAGSHRLNVNGLHKHVHSKERKREAQKSGSIQNCVPLQSNTKCPLCFELYCKIIPTNEKHNHTISTIIIKNIIILCHIYYHTVLLNHTY